MGRRDGYKRAHPAVLVHLQPHGLWKLHGLPGTLLKLHAYIFLIFLWSEIKCGFVVAFFRIERSVA